MHCTILFPNDDTVVHALPFLFICLSSSTTPIIRGLSCNSMALVCASCTQVMVLWNLQDAMPLLPSATFSSSRRQQIRRHCFSTKPGPVRCSAAVHGTESTQTAGSFSLNSPVYLPFKPGPYKMTMGLAPLPDEEWIEIDDKYDEEIALRQELMRTHGSLVVNTQPEVS